MGGYEKLYPLDVKFIIYLISLRRMKNMKISSNIPCKSTRNQLGHVYFIYFNQSIIDTRKHNIRRFLPEKPVEIT
jgi:hypothetical protein